MMEHYHLNNQITDLWNKFNFLYDDYHKEVMNRVPSYLSIPKSKDKILFIGLNPAYQDRKETHKNYINYSFKPDISIDSIINFCQINEHSKNPEKTKWYYGKYFNILHNFAKNLGEDGFEHCDLFLMRETDSKIVKKMVENSAGDLNEFGMEQVNILKIHIENLNPKVIIIPNAMAAEYYSQIILRNSKIDDEKGIYFSEINNKKIPTILCGSWQYGRLDKYTESILIRHIKTAMN